MTHTQGTSVPSIFQFNSQKIRTLLIHDQPWFVASDIAAILEYRNAPDLTRILDDDERGTQIVRTPSGEQAMTIINESGLYSAILRSRKSEAKRFKKWVTYEVLPSIRKTGKYEVVQPVRITQAQYQELAKFANHWSSYFYLRKQARYAIWAWVRSICGTRAAEMPADKYPFILAQFQAIDRRFREFLNLQTQFEIQTIKWMLNQNEDFQKVKQYLGRESA